MAYSHVVKHEPLRPQQQFPDLGIVKVEAPDYDELGFAMRGEVSVVEISSSGSSDGKSMSTAEVGEEVVSPAPRPSNGKRLHSGNLQQEALGSELGKRPRLEPMDARADLGFVFLGTSDQGQSSAPQQTVVQQEEPGEQQEDQEISELPFDFLEPLNLGRGLQMDDVSFSPMQAPSPLAFWSAGKSVSRQFWKAGDYESDQTVHKSLAGGMDHVRVHPRFLHSNATSHKWALGAIAELLDNALDEVVNGATFVNVDMIRNPRDGEPMLLVEDDGGGMNPENMRQCMSLGYSAKSKIANTIGQYGNGFKTSTMRLGADVIVFSQCRARDGCSATQSIGMLSYTFLRETGQEDIFVPMVDYEIQLFGLRKLIRANVDDWSRNLEAIRQWSPYSSEAELLDQFQGMKHQGTRIIVYNLWEDDQGQLELDFDANPFDIQVRGANRDEKNIQMAEKFPNSRHYLTYRHSLRSYASILYLRLPVGFRMMLRGTEVVHHNLIDDLMFTQEVTYKPQGGSEHAQKETGLMKAVVTIGFVKDAKEHIDVQGFNVYHKNRLIKPFWRIWNSAASRGRGIIGVLEANFVEPAHDKQGFERTIVLARLEARLLEMQKTYWSKNCHKVGYVNSMARNSGKSTSKGDSVSRPDPSLEKSPLQNPGPESEPQGVVAVSRSLRSQTRESVPGTLLNLQSETEVEAALRSLHSRIQESIPGNLSNLRPENDLQAALRALKTTREPIPGYLQNHHPETDAQAASVSLQTQVSEPGSGRVSYLRPESELHGLVAVSRSLRSQTHEATSIHLPNSRLESQVQAHATVSESVQPRMHDTLQGSSRLEVEPSSETSAVTRPQSQTREQLPHDQPQIRSGLQSHSSPITGARSFQSHRSPTTGVRSLRPGTPEESSNVPLGRAEAEAEAEAEAPPNSVTLTESLPPQVSDDLHGCLPHTRPESDVDVSPIPSVITRSLRSQIQRIPARSFDSTAFSLRTSTTSPDTRATSSRTSPRRDANPSSETNAVSLRTDTRLNKKEASSSKTSTIPDAHASSSRTSTRLDTNPSSESNTVSLRAGTRLNKDPLSSKTSTTSNREPDVCAAASRASTITHTMQDTNAMSLKTSVTTETIVNPLERRPEGTSETDIDLLNAIPLKASMTTESSVNLLEQLPEETCETDETDTDLLKETRSETDASSTRLSTRPESSTVRAPMTRPPPPDKETDVSPAIPKNLRFSPPRSSKSNGPLNKDSPITRKSLVDLGRMFARKVVATEKVPNFGDQAGTLDSCGESNRVASQGGEGIGINGCSGNSEMQLEAKLAKMQKQFQVLQRDMEELMKERDSLREQLQEEQRQEELNKRELQKELDKALCKVKELEAENTYLRLASC